VSCSYLNKPIGSAASIKLLRSIFMKGIEGLIIESLGAAEYYGVKKEVLNSIIKTMSTNDFENICSTLIYTHSLHNKRRLNEVIESQKLIEEANLPSDITNGTRLFFERSTSLKWNINDENKHNSKEILQDYISKY